MKKVKKDPRDIAPELSLVAGRMDYKQTKSQLRLLDAMKKEGRNLKIYPVKELFREYQSTF